ncbi:MAG: AAA family ATPase [Candidatus Thiodiazotropha lotti]|nr:AAA family ATPase [Candidatus Thiodiazotropha lotti]
MRILAIRGENLASLAAPFDIDFESSPLGDVGLFAISGPTGSGKSTILDAMCLALFDTIPRLPSGHGVLVGGDDEEESKRLRNTDVRSILRRGAPEGFAEVDFLGNDGRRYRARWEVRRARRRADGKIQPQQLKLTDIATDASIGQTKTEVLAEIQERLGLNFDQFRRSVLLAQGDFAAFLRATADERASLLERITGTELYTAISREAFHRAGHEQSALDQLHAQRSGFIPLNEDDRAALESRVAAAQEVQSELSEVKKAIDKDLDWYQQQDVLKAARGEAQKQLAESQAAFEEAKDRRALLEQVRSVQPHRTAFDRCREAAVRCDRAKASLGSAEVAAEDAKRQQSAAQAQQDSLSSEFDAVGKAYEQLIPKCREARELDTKLGMAEAALNEAESKSKAQRLLLTAAEQRTDSLSTGQRESKEALDAARSWLTDHQEYADLVGEWPRWERELQRVADVLAVKAAIDEEREGLLQDKEQAVASAATANETVQGLTGLLAEKRSELTVIESEVAKMPGEGLRQRQRALIQQETRLRDRHSLFSRSQSVLQDLLAQRELLAQADTAIEAANTAHEDAARNLPIKLAQLSEAESAHRLALATQDQQAQHLRSLLQDDQSCPVCGSDDHPWRHQVGVLDEQIQQLHERVENLRRERDALDRQVAQNRGLIESAKTKSDAARSKIDNMSAELEALREQWSNLPPDEFSEHPLDDHVLAREIESVLIDVQQKMQAVENSLAELDVQESKRDEFRQEVDGLREEFEVAQSQFRDETQKLSALSLDEKRLDVELQRCANDLAGTHRELDAALSPFVGWKRALSSELGVFKERCETWVRLWREKESLASASERTLSDLDKDFAEAKADQANLLQAVEHCQKDESRHKLEVERLSGKRAQLFDGKPIDDVEAEWSQKITTAKNAWNAAQAKYENANVAAAQTLQALRSAETAFNQEKTELEHAQSALDGVLAAVGFNAGQLEGLLSYGGDWIVAEADALQAIDTKLSRDRTIVGEREGALGRHMIAKPEADQPVLIALRDENAKKLATATETSNAEVFQLRKDDDNRDKWGRAAEEIERQAEKTGLWASINDLIGSADGKKFRVFAQSLTLEALLGFANAHLKDLSHRYRLQRVPGSDLDLQIIDADMGDEIRSVHSLSGGESFLVSLALALGLASLSSQRAQVESLFIDEGFGSLDQDALDVAISSLDSLQSLGRRVGVISHVQTMVERIGTRVMVYQMGGGRSTISTVAA